MFKSTLFVAAALFIATGFTFFTNNWTFDDPIPTDAIFYAKEGNPNWLKIKDGVQVTATTLVNRYHQDLGLGSGDELVLIRKDDDDLGFSHYRYQHFNNGIKVKGSQLLVHEKEGTVKTLNGRLARGIERSGEPNISEQEAVERALEHLPADLYMWESKREEDLLKRILKDPLATNYPEPELVLIDPTMALAPENMRLAYSMIVYAARPHSRKLIYVDAHTGKVFHEIEMLLYLIHI